VRQVTVNRHYLCERCGGTGKQPAGCWDGKAYGASAGRCDDCHGVGILGFMEVTHDEFFATVGAEDCHPRVIGSSPHVSHFELRGSREVIGAIVGDDCFFVPTAVDTPPRITAY